jgi:hypothetical protein
MSEEEAEEPRARTAVSELADERVLGRLFRRKGVRTRVTMPPPPPTLELHVEPERWGAGFLRVREVDLPAELYRDLHELTPQALLRDLFRPVWREVLHERQELVPPRDPADQLALRQLRESRRRAPLPRIEPSARAVSKEMLRRRAFVAERWQPHHADDADRPVVEAR